MTSRRSAPRGRSRARRPNYEWLNFSVFNTTLTDGGETTADLLGGLTLVEKNRVRTIVRVIWQFQVRSATAGNRAAGRFGLIKVSDDAMAVTQVPDPLGDHIAGWYLNVGFFQEDAANVPVVLQGDLRSKRRLLGDAETIAWVAESDTSASVGSAQLTFLARILYTTS